MNETLSIRHYTKQAPVDMITQANQQEFVIVLLTNNNFSNRSSDVTQFQQKRWHQFNFKRHYVES